MRRALRFALTIASLLQCSALTARADVPPGGLECSLEKRCKDGQTCPTLGGEVDKDCAADLVKKGFNLSCVEDRAMKGKAVFCSGAAAKKGCGKSSVAPSAGDGAAALGLLASALVVAGLRRARSRRLPTR